MPYPTTAKRPIDPLDYHGPCEPCVHNRAGNISICGPCLTPSPAGHNGQFRFEPAKASPEMARAA